MCWSLTACAFIPCPRPLRPQAGNEAVLRARFEDAQFFYQNDLTTPLREAR